MGASSSLCPSWPPLCWAPRSHQGSRKTAPRQGLSHGRLSPPEPGWAMGMSSPGHSRGDVGPGAACFSAASPPGAGCEAGPESVAKVLQPWDLQLQVHAVAPSFQSDPQKCGSGFCCLPRLGATWGHLSRGGWLLWQRPPAWGQDSRPVCGNARGSLASNGVPLCSPASPRPPSHGARGSHEVCALSLRGGCMSKGGHEDREWRRRKLRRHVSGCYCHRCYC